MKSKCRNMLSASLAAVTLLVVAGNAPAGQDDFWTSYWRAYHDDYTPSYRVDHKRFDDIYRQRLRADYGVRYRDNYRQPRYHGYRADANTSRSAPSRQSDSNSDRTQNRDGTRWESLNLQPR